MRRWWTFGLAILLFVLAVRNELLAERAISEALRTKQYDTAEQIQRARIARWERVVGEDHPLVGLWLWRLAASQDPTNPEIPLATLARAERLLGTVGPDTLIRAEVLRWKLILLRTEQWQEGEALLSVIEAIDRDSFGGRPEETRYARARLHMERAPQWAASEFEAMLAHRPPLSLHNAHKASQLWYNLGLARMNAHQYPAAREAFEHALEEPPHLSGRPPRGPGAPLQTVRCRLSRQTRQRHAARRAARLGSLLQRRAVPLPPQI